MAFTFTYICTSILQKYETVLREALRCEYKVFGFFVSSSIFLQLMEGHTLYYTSMCHTAAAHSIPLRQALFANDSISSVAIGPLTVLSSIDSTTALATTSA